MPDEHATEGPAEINKLTVYFDGSCSLCRREVNLYKNISGDNVEWKDVSALPAGMIDPDLSKCDAMARFHVRKETGELVSGATAFAAVWRHMPGFRILAPVLSWPGIRQIAEGLYRVFLLMRPALVKPFEWMDRLKARKKGSRSAEQE